MNAQTFKYLVDYLWDNKDKIEYFYYPDCGGIDKDIADDLSIDEIDTIQNQFNVIDFYTKEEFKLYLFGELCYCGTIEGLDKLIEMWYIMDKK